MGNTSRCHETIDWFYVYDPGGTPTEKVMTAISFPSDMRRFLAGGARWYGRWYGVGSNLVNSQIRLAATVGAVGAGSALSNACAFNTNPGEFPGNTSPEWPFVDKAVGRSGGVYKGPGPFPDYWFGTAPPDQKQSTWDNLADAVTFQLLIASSAGAVVPPNPLIGIKPALIPGTGARLQVRMIGSPYVYPGALPTGWQPAPDWPPDWPDDRDIWPPSIGPCLDWEGDLVAAQAHVGVA